MTIPRNIVAGDSIEWTDFFPEYLSPLWSIKYSLVCPLTKIELVSEPEADTGGHSFYLPSTDTDSWQPGDYIYQVYAISEGSRATIGRGFFTVDVDFSAQDKYDARPWLDRAIDAVEASVAGRASSSQLVMEIDGSRIEHISHLDQLELLERLYKRRAARGRARDVSQGKSPFGTVRVEFNGA